MTNENANMQDTYTWFSDITGLWEDEWLERRDESILQASNGDLQIRNIQTGDIYEAGHFQLHSLESLSQQTPAPSSSPPPFEVHLRRDSMGIPFVDVAYLQPRAQDRTLFQVASNFNCAEVAHTGVHPNNGSFVSNLAIDCTQGPAASASGGVSAITRIHAPFYNPDTAPNMWGQTIHRQIELLGHPLVAPHFPVINGKLWFSGKEPEQYNPDEIFPHIRIGVHQRVRPYFGHRVPPYMEKITVPPSIDQVFVAALNRRAPLPYERHLTPKTELLLRAAYQGTYQCAKMCQNPQLILTLIGGGSFANPPALIAKAIAHAHKHWGGQTALEKVVLPLYPIGGYVQGEDFVALIQKSFAEYDMLSLLSIQEV